MSEIITAVIAVANEVTVKGEIYTKDALKSVANGKDLFYSNGKLLFRGTLEKLLDKFKVKLTKQNISCGCSTSHKAELIN